MNDFVALIIRIVTGARGQWRGCLPEEKQRIYFANHTSHLDAVTVWATLPSRVRKTARPVGARDYWEANEFRRWLAVKVFRALLIERINVTARNNPLQIMLASLAAGDSLIIFPEGTRSFGLEPNPFKSGLFHLAKDRPDIELIPIYLENMNRILPKGEFLPVPLLGSITIGSPVRLGEGEDRATFLERARMAVWSLHNV